MFTDVMSETTHLPKGQMWTTIYAGQFHWKLLV